VINFDLGLSSQDSIDISSLCFTYLELMHAHCGTFISFVCMTFLVFECFIFRRIFSFLAIAICWYHTSKDLCWLSI